MKYVKTFEAYITYDKMGNWGSPSEIEDELRTELTHLFKYANISSQLNDFIYTDQ